MDNPDQNINETSTSEQGLFLNKVKERLLILSPTVRAGLERECNKGDFYREGDKCIGKGGFGEVWKVVHKKSNVTYVIKVIDKKSIKNQKLVNQINREIEIMYKVHHPHLMQLINHFEDDDKFFMIMPYASKGQLYTLLRRQVRFDQRTAAQYMRETIEAVKYLHEHKIMHRDIKPENLLLDENYRVKLSDFGWSNFKEDEDTRKTYCGTPEYLSPEMVKKLPHDYSIDIWSLGVLLFEFLSGYAPFTGNNQNELFLNIKRLKINWPVDFPPLAKNLVSKILKLNPKERPALEEIITHSWFEKNPPLRPVLINTLIEEIDILKFHLINVSPEQIAENLNNNNGKRKTSSIQQMRKTNTLQNNNNNSHSIHNMNDTNESSYINSPIYDSSVSVSASNSMISLLQAENDKLAKENGDLKAKIIHYETEAKTNLNELTKLRELNIDKTNDKIRELTEEIEKYKAMNNERLVLLSEIEEKNNKIVDLNKKIKHSETEYDNNNRELTASKERNAELNKLLNEKSDIIDDMQKKIMAVQIEKDEASNALQRKVMVLQTQMFDKAEETNNIDALEKVIQMVSETITDFKNTFGTKLASLTSFLTEFKEEFIKRNNSFKDLLNTKTISILDIVKKYRTNINDDMTQLQLQMNNIVSNKEKEVIEWYKKQISELLSFKGKIIAYEAKVSQLENENEILKQKSSVAHNERNVLAQREMINKDKIDKLTDEVDTLSSKLEDIISHVLENSKDKNFLNEFKASFYQTNKK